MTVPFTPEPGLASALTMLLPSARKRFVVIVIAPPCPCAAWARIWLFCKMTNCGSIEIFPPPPRPSATDALIVLFTDLVGTEPSRRLLTTLGTLTPRHLPLVIAQRNREIEATATGRDNQAISGRTNVVVHRGQRNLHDRDGDLGGEPDPLRRHGRREKDRQDRLAPPAPVLLHDGDGSVPGTIDVGGDDNGGVPVGTVRTIADHIAGNWCCQKQARKIQACHGEGDSHTQTSETAKLSRLEQMSPVSPMG